MDSRIKSDTVFEDVSYELNAENIIYDQAVLQEQREVAKIIQMSFHYKKPKMDKDEVL